MTQTLNFGIYAMVLTAFVKLYNSLWVVVGPANLKTSDKHIYIQLQVIGTVQSSTSTCTDKKKVSL